VSAFATDAAPLVAAEGRDVADGPIAVDPYGSGFEGLGAVEGSSYWRPETGRQAIWTVVRDRERFVLVIEWNDQQNGPEHLFLGDALAVANHCEDGRFDAPPKYETRRIRFAAVKDALRTLRFRDIDVFTTPGGNPASENSSAKARVEADACSDGSMITVLPTASSGASFQVNKRSGEFQRTIAATTPTDSRRV
jgi:hypothetical protein